MKALVLALALLSACTWNNRQRALGVVTAASLVIDWRQTFHITARCTEANPIIGECGDRVHPNVYFPLVIYTVFVAADLLPEWRDIILGGVTGAQAATIWDNSTGYNAVPIW